MEHTLHQLQEEYKAIHVRMKAILDLNGIGRYSISRLPENHHKEWRVLNHRLYQVLKYIKHLKRSVN